MHKNLTKTQENSILWLVKIIAGMFIVILLAIHFIVNHMVAPEGLLSYADVIAYYKNPLIPAMEIVFLFVVLVHALLGIRSIILDTQPSDRFMKVLDIVLMVTGILAFMYGVWLALTIAAL